MSALGPWRQGDLPHPPAFTLGNVGRVIGPGTILLGVSLGAGDWLLGPAVVARHGPALLWLCTLSVVLQALLNTEMARYTVATGEPITTGFMRTAPGARFWAWTYSALHLCQVGWPGWAMAAGSALAALFLGRMPRDEDHLAVLALGYLVFLGAVGLVLLGDRARRAIEGAEWTMMAWMLLFLVAVGLFLVPWATWGRVAHGFVGPLLGHGTGLPPDADWVLLAAFAAYSGAGGTINATLTHWLRDKGFGMAGTVAVTPTRIGGQRVPLARAGTIFPPTPDNLAKWRQWWRYLYADLWWLWTAGCLVGMGLPALLAVEFIAPGTDMAGPGAGAVLAHALDRHHGFVLGSLGLLTAFWLLFSTQLGITEGCARSVTDMLWTAGVRERPGGAGGVYYVTLAVFTIAGCAVMAIAEPLTLVLIGANVAVLNFAILAFHTLWVNRRLLPPPLRPSLWREAAVALCGLFFASLAAAALWGLGGLAAWR